MSAAGYVSRKGGLRGKSRSVKMTVQGGGTVGEQGSNLLNKLVKSQVRGGAV